MKKSLKIKIFVILICSIVAVILFYWLLNTLILEKYYVSKKKDILIESYNTINNCYNISVEDIELEFERIDKNKNVSVSVMNEERKYIYTSDIWKGEMEQILSIPRIDNRPLPTNENGIVFEPQMPNEPFVPQNEDTDIGNSTSDKQNHSQKDNIKTDNRMQLKEHIVSTDKYRIEKIYDNKLNSYFFTLTSKLDNGYFLYLRTPLESISESVKISNQFLIITGMVILFISSILMYLISKSITKPIMELSCIAKNMAGFDFSQKYKIISNDEIGILGESINTLSEQLEEKISELKQANIELQRDLEQKLKVDQMRKDFLSNVSHELKTPIALIRGYAEGLKDNIIQDQESKDYYLEVILDEAEKMNTMVRKLLTLNQLEFGKDIVSLRRFDIIEMLKAFVQKNEIMTKSKNITVKINAPENLFVWADEFMIEEVFTNYMTNACNHIADEKIIEINAQKNEDIARISVSNTGSHIPEDELDKIWISFYKVDKARTREYGGSGIGLSVVKATMDLHNQRCGAYNTDSGITFWFELDCSNGK